MTNVEDLESALRADLAFAERVAPAPADLVERLLTRAEQVRPGRREVARWVWPALAAAAVAIVVIATLMMVNGGLLADRKSTPAHPLPGDFHASAVQFVDQRHGWAAGGGTCGQQLCAALAVTSDGGTSWRALPAPAGLAYEQQPLLCPTCIGQLAFAPDGRHGYLTNELSGSLYLTSDGGHSWAEQSTRQPTAQLVATASNALRVAEPANTGDRLLVAPLGTTAWRDVTPWPDSVQNPQLAVHGSTVYAFAAGPQYAWLYRSTDSGRTWTHIDSSYLRHTPATYDLGRLATWTFALSPDGALAVARLVEGGAATIRVSTDGGAAFGPARPLAVPAGIAAKHLTGVRIAAVSSHDLIETARDSSGGDTYFVTTAAGASWRAVAHGTNQPGTAGVGWAFAANGFGYRLSDDFASVLISTDSGASTLRRPFRP